MAWIRWDLIIPFIIAMIVFRLGFWGINKATGKLMKKVEQQEEGKENEKVKGRV